MAEDSDRTVEPEEAEKPPSPPEIGRAFAMHRYQYIGVPALLAIVVLALAGVFGESWDEGAAEGSTVALEWRYPERFRYKQINTVRLDITNRSASMLDTVMVSFEPSYMDRFSTVNAIPSFSDPWEIPVTAVLAGETRRVLVEIQAERYGRHRGEVSVAAGGDTVRAELGTLVFP